MKLGIAAFSLVLTSVVAHYHALVSPTYEAIYKQNIWYYQEVIQGYCDDHPEWHCDKVISRPVRRHLNEISVFLHPEKNFRWKASQY
jgi:hypothetical protein